MDITQSDKQLAKLLYEATVGIPLKRATDFLKRNPHLRYRSDDIYEAMQSAHGLAIMLSIRRLRKGKIEGDLKAFTIGVIEKCCKKAIGNLSGGRRTAVDEGMSEAEHLAEKEKQANTPLSKKELTRQENKARLANDEDKITPAKIVEVAEENNKSVADVAKLVWPKTDVETVSSKTVRKLTYEDLQLYDLRKSFGFTQKQVVALIGKKSPKTTQDLERYVERATQDERWLLLFDAWGGPDDLPEDEWEAFRTHNLPKDEWEDLPIAVSHRPAPLPRL